MSTRSARNKPIFTFDPETHIYRLDGSVIPGFSQVAEVMGITDYSGVREDYLELARVFGDALHYAAKLLDEEILDENTLSAPLISCLDQYRKFLKDYSVKILKRYIERPIYSYRYRYGITPDRICTINDKLSVLEIKTTTALPPGVKLQTAAQKIAAEEYFGLRIKKRFCVLLPLEGNYKPYVFTNDNDYNSWLCFLGAYNWRKGNLK